MTVTEAINYIYHSFLQNPIICAKTVIKDNALVVDIPVELENIIELGLKELEKEKVCFPCGKGYYVLASPLDQQSQKIEISYPVALALSKTLNEVYAKTGDKLVCYAPNIKEQDIINLIKTVSILLKDEDKSS